MVETRVEGSDGDVLMKGHTTAVVQIDGVNGRCADNLDVCRKGVADLRHQGLFQHKRNAVVHIRQLYSLSFAAGDIQVDARLFADKQIQAVDGGFNLDSCLSPRRAESEQARQQKGQDQHSLMMKQELHTAHFISFVIRSYSFLSITRLFWQTAPEGLSHSLRPYVQTRCPLKIA